MAIPNRLPLILMLAAGPLPSLAQQLPEFYRTVDRLIWVVQDLDATLSAARKLDFVSAEPPREVDLPPATFRGEPASGRLRFASGWFADVRVHWIQPLDGHNAFQEFLKRHGSGVFSLVHRVPDEKAFEQETSRLQSLGVQILQSASIDMGYGTLRYAFFDTAPEGKYTLGLICLPAGEGPASMPPTRATPHPVSQYAFVVRELEPVSAYWAKLGFPPMTYTQSPLRNRQYRGKPAAFEMRLGWQRHGKVVYEWILSLQGPDIYREYLERHGEGFHHLAFRVEDMDAACAHWEKLGFPVIMSGAWGEEGKPGSGRFAYVDAEELGGIAIELLWNYPGK